LGFKILELQIDERHIVGLKGGYGFFNQNLDQDQKNAVVEILSNKFPLTPYTLTGPNNTGKSSVLHEVARQIVAYHEEFDPCDAA
jgi:Cdc6-like AAA superfamily ATPase